MRPTGHSVVGAEAPPPCRSLRPRVDVLVRAARLTSSAGESPLRRWHPHRRLRGQPCPGRRRSHVRAPHSGRGRGASQRGRRGAGSCSSTGEWFEGSRGDCDAARGADLGRAQPARGRRVHDILTGEWARHAGVDPSRLVVRTARLEASRSQRDSSHSRIDQMICARKVSRSVHSSKTTPQWMQRNRTRVGTDVPPHKR
jgi:hypothetical protein